MKQQSLMHVVITLYYNAFSRAALIDADRDVIAEGLGYMRLPNPCAVLKGTLGLLISDSWGIKTAKASKISLRNY